MLLGMKIISIFLKLPYWKHLLVAHLMDPMCIVKNVASSLYQYTINTKYDIVNVSNDLRETNTKCLLWI